MIACFIGHRKIENQEAIEKLLTATVSELIQQGTDTFLFGSRSDFDALCWNIVTELQKEYPHIKRISYNAPHEAAFTSKEEREQFEKIATKIIGQEVHYADYEGAVTSQKSLKANKNAYVMRNQEMIDACDTCVFYYNKGYLPPRRKQSKRDLTDYQPQSGTAIAFTYAQQKKKRIINLYEVVKPGV